MAEILEKLFNMMEKHYEHFTVLKFTTGWKVVIGTPHLENSTDPKSDYQRLSKNIKTSKSLVEAIIDCIDRGDDGKNKF